MTRCSQCRDELCEDCLDDEERCENCHEDEQEKEATEDACPNSEVTGDRDVPPLQPARVGEVAVSA